MNDTDTRRKMPLALSEAAQETGISYNTLKAAIRDGRLPAIKIGPRAWTVTLDDIEAALADQRIRPGKPGRPERHKPTSTE